MTSFDSHHAGADSLDRLSALVADPDRAKRVRAKCRTELERSSRRAARSAAMAGFAWRVVAPAFLAAFCLLYAVVFVATTLRLEGVFQ